jgi:precorrin-6Y C5,15-methyltransferase (decarboxylating)
MLEAPDAVFVGGSKGNMREILDVCLNRLTTGGRLVVNAITLDNVTETYQHFRERGFTPEITLLQASRGEPLAHYMRYEAMNPIHIFTVEKGAPE